MLVQAITLSIPKEKIFLATTDSVIQTWFPETQVEITKQIKLLTLLGYQVVFGAPFAWQSEHTKAAILSLAPLIEAGFVGVMGREKVERASEYLRERQQDTSKLPAFVLPPESVFASEIPTSDSIVLAKNLDLLSPLIPREGNVEAEFAKIFKKDLVHCVNSPNSLEHKISELLPSRYSAFARRQAENLTDLLIELPQKGHFSRAGIYILAVEKQLPIDLLQYINLRSTALYHSANAATYHSTLFTWADLASFVPEDVKYVHQYSIAPQNPYLLQETLKVFGVSPLVIDTIPLEKFVRLATEVPEVEAFIRWYKGFVTACEVSSGNFGRSIDEAGPLLARVSKQRLQTLSSQKHRKVYAKIEKNRLANYIGILCSLLLWKTGSPFLKAGSWGLSARRTTNTAVDVLRRQCEKSIVAELGNFEAMVIKEGLRDMEPESHETYEYDRSHSFDVDRLLQPFF